MCGIVGALDLEGARAFDPAALERMAAALTHRGPDDGAYYAEPGLAMAARRLSLVGGDTGRQPLSDPSGRVWVSCNGELYDADDHRARLASRGHAFRTRCDTELWPSLYLEHGESVFSLARGQFALALWDRAERTLLLGRDRFGICPLVLAESEGWLLWASEAKALLASGLVAPRADLCAIDDMFTLFASPTSRTAFVGVSSVRPGHFVRARAGRRAEVRYFALSFPPAGEERRVERVETLVDELGAMLERAVRRRLVADQPVASYLSSGLDSALVLALLGKVDGGTRDCFTIGYDGAGPDERSGAERTAQALGARLRARVLSPHQLLDAMPRVVRAAESPVMDTADASALLLAEHAALSGYRVVLTGEGADEAMGGYVWHKAHRALRALGRLAEPLPGWVRSAAGALVAPRASPAVPSPFARFGPDLPAVMLVYELLSRGKSLLVSPDFARVVAAHDPLSDFDLSPERMRAWHPLHRSLYVEYQVMLPGHLLAGKGDRAAMASSVECRYPFLDEDFVAFAASLSPSLKLRGGTEKWLLRQLAARRLPASRGQPPKGMFKALPLCDLEPWPAWMRELVSEPSVRATGYFSLSGLRRAERLQRLLPPWAPARAALDGAYTVAVLTQLWHHLFLGGGLCRLPTVAPPDPVPLVRVV